MPLVARFRPPAGLTDLPEGSAFYDDWHRYLDSLQSDATRYGPGCVYDASRTNVTVLAERVMTWTAFPRDALLPDLRDNRREAYALADNRLRQSEYCEFLTERNAAGKITKVTFTCEVSEYWARLWNASPSTVVDLYRRLVSPAVTEAELTRNGVYNPNNRYNTTDGIAHLRRDDNSLFSAIHTAQRVQFYESADNYQAPITIPSAVDPRLHLDVSSLARKGLWVAVADPIGIYIVNWDDTGFTQPNGAPVGNYWTIQRGVPGMVLRLQYQVPEELGFVVGDLRIGGRPIEYGSQIAEHITVGIRAIVGVRQ